MCESHSALSGTDTGAVLLRRPRANSCVRAGRRFVCLFVCLVFSGYRGYYYDAVLVLCRG